MCALEVKLQVRPNLVQRLGLTLLNRRFRGLLLGIALGPTAVVYTWQTLVRPIAFPGRVIDFYEGYVAWARLLASGADPYTPCLSQGCWLQNVYPPVVSWLALPLVHLDRGVTVAVALIGAQLCVAIFILVAARALRIRDWQLLALWVLAAITFSPLMGEVVARNLQVLLLAISAIWFAGWLAGDRWWAGAALGVGLALRSSRRHRSCWGSGSAGRGRRWRRCWCSASCGSWERLNTSGSTSSRSCRGATRRPHSP